MKIQKHFYKKAILQIVLKKFFSLKTLKTLFSGHKLLMILMVKKLLIRFMKKIAKASQTELRIEKVI